jgi:hypothetical protein
MVTAEKGYKLNLANYVSDNIKSQMDGEEDDLYSLLKKRTERVRSWYHGLYIQYISGTSETDLETTVYEKKMLASCQRWHINSHMRY